MGYEEALRLIEEARETGATKLYLSNQGLTELPTELFQLKNLNVLDLSNNQLASLPLELFQLANLKSLALDTNQLINLPPEIVQLKKLIALALSHNQLTKGWTATLREIRFRCQPAKRTWMSRSKPRKMTASSMGLSGLSR